MSPIKKQLLKTLDEEPTTKNIKSGLKESYKTYQKFLNLLESHGIRLEWNYYNDGKAWLGKGEYSWIGARGGRKKATVFWLSIWEGFFKISVFIPEKAREEVLGLPLSEDFKDIIKESKRMGEKLRYYPLIFEASTDELLDDLFVLFEYRKSM